MVANMALEHFRHQAIQRPSGRGNQAQDFAALGLPLERPCKGVYLPADASDPMREPLFSANGVRHASQYSPPGYRLYPGWVSDLLAVCCWFFLDSFGGAIDNEPDVGR
jgi:hypothetical protein